MMHDSALAPEDKLDLVYAFQQELSKDLQLVVPFTSGAGGTIDIGAWLAAVDARCEVHQLRHYLLTHTVVPEILAALVGRFIALPHPSGTDRSKIDLLLVHYLAQTISSEQVDLTLVSAAKLLEPVLGSTTPAPGAALMTLVKELDAAGSLRDLLGRKVLEGMQKVRAEQHDYTRASMVIFAWMGLRARRTCVRLRLADIDSIEGNLACLKLLGIKHLPMREGAAEQEVSIAELTHRCHGWKHPFPGTYRGDSWLVQIAELRTLTQSALQVIEGMPRTGTPATSSSNTVIKKSPASKQNEPPASEETPSPLEPLIAEILSGLENLRSADFARVYVGQVAVILSSAEIRAFRSGETPFSSLLKNMVASRALLGCAAKSSDQAQLENAKRIVADLLVEARNAVTVAEQSKDSESAIDLHGSMRTLEKALAR
jgi:hypothetical protein